MRSDDPTRRMRAILDASIAALLVVRVREESVWLEVVEANQAAADLFHTTVADLRASDLPAEILAPLRDSLARVHRTGVPVDVDVELLHPRVRGGAPAQVHGRAVRIDGEIALGLVDLTERDALYRRAALDDRLASLGRVAAGVAHEFNNPLAWITAGVEQIRASLAARRDVELLEIADEVLQGTERLRRIVEELRPTVAKSGPDPAGSLVGETVDAAARMAAHRIQRRGHLHLAVDRDLPRVVADPARLAQVLLNLILNAAESLPEPEIGGGNVTVSASRHGDEVVVRIVDDGRGIGELNLARVFEPFFTTRAASGGTGLGLWLSRGIVESFGGRLSLSSTVGVGTQVELRLQVAAAVPGGPQAGPSAVPVHGDALRLLVLDDEVLVARSVVRALPEHRAVLETHASVALERINAGERFDAILCDLTMPGMDGFEFLLAAEMLDEGLAGRIIVMSGGTDAETWRTLQDRAIPTLDKPFELPVLRDLLAKISPRTPRGTRAG